MSTANTFIEEDGFGLVPQCRGIVRRYTMTNEGKSSVRLITWGAGIQSIRVPNDRGIIGDVVLGYDSMDGYSKTNNSKSLIGKVTNLASSSEENSECQSIEDHEKNQRSFDHVNWESYILGKQVVMSNISHSSAADWPGLMLTQVKFSWTNDNELHINIRASSTEPMPSNVTTQCLFNLAGHGTGPKELRNHVVTINASKWTFFDVRDKVPTGAVRPVDSTIYDLRFPTLLSNERLRQVPGGGYDHNLCIDAPSSWCYRFHARILHPGSGRFMEVYSNQPGLQFYTGNDIPEPGRLRAAPDFGNCCSGECGDGLNSNSSLSERKISTRLKDIPGKDGVLYRRHGGFGMTPQNYPNAINTDGFPPCILYPGKIYAHDMTYKFGTLEK